MNIVHFITGKILYSHGNMVYSVFLAVAIPFILWLPMLKTQKISQGAVVMTKTMHNQDLLL